ncbi:hypothetical protein KA005_43285, partial [bacterium]|nr:hypothetical protein [bacterium]
MDNFYVYVYLDQDNIPFYVGKGKNIRYNIIKHLYGSNQFLIRKIKKVGVKNVKIMFPLKNVDEADAFAYEELFIGIVGRRDLGLGPLCNLTDGGEGCSGAIGYWKGKHLSEETRQKMRDSHKGKSGSNKGRKFGPPSEEIKRKISEGNKG